MPAAAIATLVLAGVLVLALVVYLVRVIRTLSNIRDTLGKVTFGVRAIAHQTSAVPDLVGAIEEDTSAIDAALSGLVARKTIGRAS
jgi:uncharacterized protein YoxC